MKPTKKPIRTNPRSRAARGNQNARKKPAAEKYIRVAVDMPRALFDRIEDAAEARQCSRMEIIRDALAEKLF